MIPGDIQRCTLDDEITPAPNKIDEAITNVWYTSFPGFVTAMMAERIKAMPPAARVREWMFIGPYPFAR